MPIANNGTKWNAQGPFYPHLTMYPLHWEVSRGDRAQPDLKCTQNTSSQLYMATFTHQTQIGCALCKDNNILLTA